MTLKTPDASPWNERVHFRSTPSETRSNYDIDRDRIVHSETFRDLQYKTQVQGIIGAGNGSHFRTRLNHVIEVAQLSRSLARALDADESLAEGIALAHDLGHPPFGHAGERALSEALSAHGRSGWNANTYSLAVVDEVERAFTDFKGLNLTWSTREGIARHSTPFDEPVSVGEFTDWANGGIECQIVDACDVLAYISHDLDDALSGGYVEVDEIGSTSPVLEHLVARAHSAAERSREAWPKAEAPHLMRRYLVSRLIHATVEDIVGSTQAQGTSLGVETAEQVRQADDRLVVQSPEFQDMTKSLLAVLTKRYYRSPRVSEADRMGAATVRTLFDRLLEDPEQVPARFRSEDELDSVTRYLVSLNDRSADALSRA